MTRTSDGRFVYGEHPGDAVVLRMDPTTAKRLREGISSAVDWATGNEPWLFILPAIDEALKPPPPMPNWNFGEHIRVTDYHGPMDISDGPPDPFTYECVRLVEGWRGSNGAALTDEEVNELCQQARDEAGSEYAVQVQRRMGASWERV